MFGSDTQNYSSVNSFLFHACLQVCIQKNTRTPCMSQMWNIYNRSLGFLHITKKNEGYFLWEAKNEIGTGISKLVFVKVNGKLLLGFVGRSWPKCISTVDVWDYLFIDTLSISDCILLNVSGWLTCKYVRLSSCGPVWDIHPTAAWKDWRKTKQKPQSQQLLSGWGLNPEPPEFEAGILNFWATTFGQDVWGYIV
jgi:hypothetical protein